jgi:sulfonate transport system substrate-binding protein
VTPLREFLVVLCLLLAGAAQAQTVLRIGDQKGNARAALEAASALDGLPYRIDWGEFPAAAPLLEAASAGALDAGTVGDAPFTFAVAAGAPLKAIEATRSGLEGLAVVVRGDASTKTFKDLVGKTVATGKGSIGHQLVLALLEANGLKPDDIHLKFMLPADAAVALRTGAIDAWSTWDPYTAQLEVAAGCRSVADAQGLTPGLGFFFARDDALANADKRAALSDFVGRLAKARRWVLTHLDTYAKSWSALVGVAPEVGQKMYARAHYRVTPVDESVVADEQKTIDLYVRAGLIKTRIDAANVVSPIFTPAISAEAGP